MENKSIDFTKLIKKTFKENNHSLNIPKKNEKIIIRVENSMVKDKKSSDDKPKNK